MAISGFNGANETKTELSMSVELKLFNESGNEIINYKILNKIDIWIARDPWFSKPTLINIQANKSNDTYETIVFHHSILNASLCLDIYPSSNITNYIVLFNFLNSDLLEIKRYDLIKVICIKSKNFFK